MVATTAAMKVACKVGCDESWLVGLLLRTLSGSSGAKIMAEQKDYFMAGSMFAMKVAWLVRPRAVCLVRLMTACLVMQRAAR